MDTLIKLNNTTAGRDKEARLLQYLSRFLWYNLQKNNVDKLKSLEYQLSTFRKLLRFGRFFEGLHAALGLVNEEDWTVKTTLTLSKIANALFLFADHLLWLGRSDLVAVNTEKWSKISNKYWLYSITMNLIRDFYELSKLIHIYKFKMVRGNKSGLFVEDLLEIVKHRPDVFVDLVKNFCDFFIPLTALGKVKLSPGTVGLLGTVSSVAGLLVILDAKKKLVPS